MNKQLKNIFGLITVGFLPYLINFLILPLYSHYLTPADFGLIGLAMACMMVGSTLSNLQLPGALSRIYFDYEGETRKKYVSSVINGSFLISLVFIVFYLLLSDAITDLVFKSSEYVNLFHTVLIMLLFNLTNLSFERLLINQQKGSAILVRSLVCQGISITSGIYFIIYCKFGVQGFLYSQALYYISMTIVSFLIIRKEYRFTIDINYLLESLTYSFPLIFHAIGGVVFMYSSVFFIENMLSLSALGVFFIADKFSQVIKALVNSLNNVIMPIFNRLSVISDYKGKAFLEKLIPIWFLLILLIVLHFSFFAELFIKNYITGDYGGVFIPLFLMSSAYIFRGFYCFSSAPLFFKKFTGVIPKITILTGVLSLVFNYILIKLYGLSGASFAILASFFCSFVLAYYFSGKAYRITFSFLKNVKILGLVLVTSLIPLLFINIENIVVLSIFSTVIISVTLFTLFYFNVFELKENSVLVRELV
ncbi:hypothetical protein A3Q34_06170 [Colwellia sp. PAMC 20917]|uniref:oligosaccharide flippase family protein n=1 Tax=Colwellia sp. PAMC 20917 TaxID=1816218 RepID=UPI000878C52D|nr:oligosaccharide flippase family protein [Colwellia sp. PAMC 20917]AOW76480.1 hypothetical protein A3Q34_06170 [Colwellia sp. PAMC 20917]